MRRRLGGLLLVGLAAVTGVVVVLALRPPASPPPAGSQSPPQSGAVAAVGATVWRWVGPSDCVPAADAVPIERSVGSVWVGADVPLVTVTGLSFASAQDGIAVGTTPLCGLGVAVTRDGGRTWTSDPQNPPLLDAWYVDSSVWGIRRQQGPERLLRYSVQGGELDEAAAATDVCDAVDGTPALTAFSSRRRGLLLCSQAAISGRLLARTFNGGASWERLTDGRPETGLDGVAPVVDLDLAGPQGQTVWVLLADEACPEGQLRRSADGGASFEQLPCPGDSTSLDAVLAVAFSAPTEGVLLGLADDAPVLLVTSDGGSTWIPAKGADRQG